MSSIQLQVGDLWELGGERHYLDQVMGGGFLLFRSERTAAPFQIHLDTGEQVSPTHDWLKEQFATGLVRRLDNHAGSSRAQKTAAAQELDYDQIVATDSNALTRQIVLTSLDRMGRYSKSDAALKRIILEIWEKKSRQLAGRALPSPSTLRRWLRERGQTGHRALSVMVAMSGKVPRRKRFPASVLRRMHSEAARYWSDQKMMLGEGHDQLVAKLKRLNRYIKQRGWKPMPIPSHETFRQYVRQLECHETVRTKWGVAEADKRFKATGKGLEAHRPLLLGAMDHTLIDFHVVLDVDGWKYLGRPWLTVLIDVHSRCIVGWVLSFEPPSLYSVTECIKRANRPKLAMSAAFADDPGLVDIYGKFDELIVDNAWNSLEHPSNPP